MSQDVTDPAEEQTLPVDESLANATKSSHTRLFGPSIVSLFILIGLSLLLFSGQIIQGLTQVSPASTPQPTPRPQVQVSPARQVSPQTIPTLTPTVTVTTPFFAPDSSVVVSSLLLPSGHYVLYQSFTHIYLVSTTDRSIISLYTPGYTYNQAVSPLLTSSSQLLYSGNSGIWLTDIFDQQPVQLAQLNPNTMITSLVLSEDSKMIAWSTAPVSGNGQTDLYAGPLMDAQLVNQQSTKSCPCLSIFSFLYGSTRAADNTLLLTDDGNSGEALQYGLWSLNIADPLAKPHLIMDENNSQTGPLVFAPYSDMPLYSSNEEAVPVPTDASVPASIAALAYANSLSITTLSGVPLAMGTRRVVLPAQQILGNTALYRWVTTPTFSPDGGTLAYIEFSSDAQPPYDRHSALYTVQVRGSGKHLKVGQAKLIVTSTAKMLELGPWLNSHVVMVYGDGSLYALDVQSGALTLLATPGGYLRTLAVIGIGQT